MSTIYKKTNSGGFSLIETILALALGVMVSGMVLLAANPGLKYMRELKSTERLHANAIRTADTLAFWIKQSDYINLEDSSTLDMRATSDGATRRMELVDEQILFDGAALTDTGVRVDSLNFEQMEHSVRVHISMTYPETGKTSSYSTTIANRNEL